MKLYLLSLDLSPNIFLFLISEKCRHSCKRLDKPEKYALRNAQIDSLHHIQHRQSDILRVNPAKNAVIVKTAP